MNLNLRFVFFGLILGFGAGAGAAPTANWIQEVMAVRLFQTTLVRHPFDSGKYYLCWTDGTERFGVAFRRGELDKRLRSLPQGSRTPVMNVLASSHSAGALSTWSAADSRLCWPG